MKTFILITIAMFCCQNSALSQTDSLRVNGEFAVRGKWQTGNFAQFVINPSGRIAIEKKKTRVEAQANYEFLKVNQGSLINDFWSYVLYQYNSDKKVFPIAMTHYGYTQAYNIDHSFIGGLGMGLNIIKKNKDRVLQLNVFSGYLNLQYKDVAAHKAASIASYIKLKFPVKAEAIYFTLDSHTYVSLKNSEYHSLNSRLMLLFQVLKNFGLNMTYNLVYNNNNPTVISKTNGQLVFGFNYSFN